MEGGAEVEDPSLSARTRREGQRLNLDEAIATRLARQHPEKGEQKHCGGECLLLSHPDTGTRPSWDRRGAIRRIPPR